MDFYILSLNKCYFSLKQGQNYDIPDVGILDVAKTIASLHTKGILHTKALYIYHQKDQITSSSEMF